MDKYIIEIQIEHKPQQFEIVDTPHADYEDKCKFQVYQQNKLLATFEPDKYGYLHICKNVANIDEAILHTLAEKLESLHF